MVAQNATIYKEDYNTIQTQISDLLGTGSGDSGYGQSVTSIPVATGTLISAQSAANQWVSLYNDMKKVADHQGTNIGTLTTAYTANVTTGSIIQAADINKFSDTIGTLVANKLVAGDLALATTASVNGSRTADWGGQVGPAIVRHIFKVTFTDNNSLRAYFNSGGSIKFIASLNTTTPNQNADWKNLLEAIGTVTYNQAGSSSSGNTGTTSNIRPYDLSSQQTVYSKGGGAVAFQYTANFYQIRASRNNNVLTFEVVFEDDHTSTTPGFPYDKVTGTLTSTITYQKPNGTYISIPTPVFEIQRDLSSDAG
jgi:hypothetical protein